MKKETINDLIEIRNYFSVKNKTIFEHGAYKIMDKLIEDMKDIQKAIEDLRIKVYGGQGNEDTVKDLYEIEMMVFKEMDKQSKP